MHGSCISHFSLPFSPGQLFAHFAVNCTWEGDNTVMALQVGRAFGGLQRREAQPSPSPLADGTLPHRIRRQGARRAAARRLRHVPRGEQALSLPLFICHVAVLRLILPSHRRTNP